MPGLVVTIDGNSAGFSKEVAKAEAIAFGFSKRLEAQSAASLVQLQQQMANIDALRTKVAAAQGRSMMPDKESAAKDEAARLVDVEAATRRNRARQLIRQRRDEAKSAAQAAADAELAVQVEAAARSNRARQLWRERAERREASKEASTAAAQKSAREAAELELSNQVEAATRRNRARQLIRQRRERRDEARQASQEAAQAASEAELRVAVEAAARSNRARQLWRERAERRASTPEARAAALAAKQAEYMARKESIMGPRSTSDGFRQFMAKEMAVTGALAGAQAGTGFLGKFAEKMKGTGGSGMSQLISVVSNTLSSLGSGISPARILAQQGPNVVQAFTLMSKNAFTAMMSFLFNPMTWAVGALVGVVVGSAIFIQSKLRKSFDSYTQWLGLLRGSRTSLVDVAQANDDVAKAMRDHANMVEELISKHDRLGDALEAGNRILAERHQLELSLAKARGLSEQQITALTLRQEKEMLVQKTLNKLKLDRQVEESLAASNAANAAANNPNAIAEIRNAAQDEKRLIEFLKAAEDKVEGDQRLRELVTSRQLMAGANNENLTNGSLRPDQLERVSRLTAEIAARRRQLYGQRSTITAADGTTINQSVASLQAELATKTQKRKELEDAQARLVEAEKKAASGLQADVAARDRAREDVTAASEQLKLHEKFLPQIAASGRTQGAFTATQRIGDFGGFGGVTLIDITKKGNIDRAKILTVLEEIKQRPGGIPGF